MRYEPRPFGLTMQGMLAKDRFLSSYEAITIKQGKQDGMYANERKTGECAANNVGEGEKRGLKRRRERKRKLFRKGKLKARR